MDDVQAMYLYFDDAKKKNVCLWCDGQLDECENGNFYLKKPKRDDSPVSKHDDRERESDKIEYTEPWPQYHLWACMIQNGLHSSKETLPQVPMITGIAPSQRKRKTPDDSLEHI